MGHSEVEGKKAAQENASQGLWLSGYSQEQAYFLTRLKDLLERRDSHKSSPNADPFQLRLLNRAIYATLQDCIEVGVGQEARALLHPEKTQPLGGSTS